ncbi:MAG: WecB/TagA/CpsF family glycosyltransferase [Planctomycetaceae bacterium]|nr:WecB/TagA/CpsF family glycosyltransferase [Planctomycetaceae bacterium]
MCTRIELLGVTVDPLSQEQAVGQIHAWIASGETRCRYVVMPSAHHFVLLRQHAHLQAAYAQAGLVLPASAPVVWAADLLNKPLAGRVAGKDLVPALFAAADEENPIKVFLLGAGPGVAERAAVGIHRRWPGVKVVGTYSPPLGFENDHAENLRILARIADARPDLLVVGLGAPKQELWVHQHRSQIRAKVALCAGRAIDQLAGGNSNLPAWMRELGLEWLHRIVSEPRRLVARYARDIWVFPQIVAREWWRQAREPSRVRS